MNLPLWLYLEPLDTAILTLYYTVLGVLCGYGLHRLSLLRVPPPREHEDPPLQAQSHVASERRSPVPPFVTVQLPIFNEPAVARRLIAAVAAFSYPRDRFEIQVLDDSTDATTEEVRAAVADSQARGVRVRHLVRERRTGYKAGALREGLRTARGELIAIFDADFVPEPDFLERCVPAFEDPRVAMVQARWAHLNRRRSLLTRIQAILLDGHFLIEHWARYYKGLFFNFNGTAGIWRKQAITEAGGWQHDTLTEDLDLSYRCQMAGWKFVFKPDVCAPAELPTDFLAFRSQQRRWTQGSIQTLRKLGGELWRTPLSTRVRLEALVHLTSNLAYPLLVLLAVLMPWAGLARSRADLDVLVALDVALFALAFGSLAWFYAKAQRWAGRSALVTLVQFPAVMALGIGMSLFNSVAVVRGLRIRGGEFVRTPKSGDRDSVPKQLPGAPATNRARRRSGSLLRPQVERWQFRSSGPQLEPDTARLGAAWWATGLLGGYLLWGAWQGLRLEALWFVPFQILFAVGYLVVCAAIALSMRRQSHRQRTVCSAAAGRAGTLEREEAG